MPVGPAFLYTCTVRHMYQAAAQATTVCVISWGAHLSWPSIADGEGGGEPFVRLFTVIPPIYVVLNVDWYSVWLLSLWTVEFGESFCTRASTAYDLCCETFPGDTYLVSSYWTKKSHPIVNCSSPRDQLEVNDNTASERRAIGDHDGKLTDICVLCGGKIII